MALRPRTVKAGSLAAIAVPTVLGSTLLSPASAFAPVVQDIPGAAAQGSLFTATVQPTLSQVAVQVRQQAEAPATNQIQPIQQTYTAQAAQATPPPSSRHRQHRPRRLPRRHRLPRPLP